MGFDDWLRKYKFDNDEDLPLAVMLKNPYFTGYDLRDAWDYQRKRVMELAAEVKSLRKLAKAGVNE